MIAVLVPLLGLVSGAPTRVMPWMCLERCGANTTEIEKNLQEISKIRDLLAAVSYERYNLGANSTLILNNLTDPTEKIQSFGLQTFPMVSSYPYPPQFLTWMRQVFQNPDPFINAMIEAGTKFKYTGWNLDWEPTVNGTAEDALNYAVFLNSAALKLQEKGMLLTVDVATWNPIWNLSAIAATNVNRMMFMSTYTGGWTTWQHMLDIAVSKIGLEKLGVGLDTHNPGTKDLLTEAQVRERFSALSKAGVLEVDIWAMPLPDYWIPILQEFVG